MYSNSNFVKNQAALLHKRNRLTRYYSPSHLHSLPVSRTGAFVVDPAYKQIITEMMAMMIFSPNKCTAQKREVCPMHLLHLCLT